MRRAAPWIVTAVLLVVMLGLMGWALYAAEALTGGWEGLRPILPYVVVGLVFVGGLTGVLMWLAFYSSRHGYDEPFDLDEER